MTQIEPGRIYAHQYGYSITAYRFYKCIEVAKRFIWVRELGKKFVSGDGQQGLVVCTYEPIDDEIKRLSLSKTYLREYNGEKLYEDHMD